MKGRAKFAAALLVAAALLAAGCGGSGGSGGDRLTLVAYSTPREAYEQLIPAFQSLATRPASTSLAMSGSREKVTTSAARPFWTARLWSPEAP